MKKAYSEFKRGDVWYVRLNSEFGDNNDRSSVQKKSRPYLICSCEQNNNCAPTLNCVPISTGGSDHLPMHVYYRYGNRDQLVLCEQITTLSVHDFHRDGSHFMYSFNLEFMNKIDEALASQLGLTPRVADMKVLEKLIEKLAADKEAEMKRKYEDAIEARVSAIADKLAKKFGVSLSADDMLDGVNYRPEQLRYVDKNALSEMEETIKERTTPTASTNKQDKTLSEKYVGNLDVYGEYHVETKHQVEQSVPAETVKQKKSKRTNNKWTNEAMKAFLEDYKHLSISAMASKWSMAKKSVATYASLFRKKLEKD